MAEFKVDNTELVHTDFKNKGNLSGLIMYKPKIEIINDKGTKRASFFVSQTKVNDNGYVKRNAFRCLTYCEQAITTLENLKGQAVVLVEYNLAQGTGKYGTMTYPQVIRLEIIEEFKDNFKNYE